MNATQLAILTAASDMPIGTSRRVLCPSCRGGQSGERSMVITRTATEVQYYCHRASCPASGTCRSCAYADYWRDEAGAVKTPEDTAYTQPTLPVEDDDLAYFSDRFFLPFEATKRYISVSQQGEYIIDIREPHFGAVAGVVVRQPTWQGKPTPPRKGVAGAPKSRVYMRRNDPTLAYFPAYGAFTSGHWVDEPLILVEDQISAIRLSSTGHNAAALIGVGLNMEKVTSIALLQPSVVKIALDRDALQHSMQLAKKWGMAFRDCKVVCLPCDVKDMTDREYRYFRW